MSPCACGMGRAVIGPPCPGDRDRLAGGQPMLAHDRRVLAAGRRLEAIAEAGAHRFGGLLVEVDVDRPPLLDEQRAQVVDAVGVVGMLVGIEHAVEPIDFGIEELLAQIGRGVDKDTGNAARAASLDQKRGAPAPVLRIVRVASAPAKCRAGHAAGRSAAQNGELERHFRFHAATAAGRGTLPNRRKKFSVVCRAISSNETQRTSASTFAVSTT